MKKTSNNKCRLVRRCKFWNIEEQRLDNGKIFRYAVSKEGYFIDTVKTANLLYKKYGIVTFEPLSYDLPTSHACCIGWSERDKLWYGWSHRAIAGFKDKAKARRFAKRVS